ncbi:YadA-like family protein [Acinetobacter johnsonii]|uniref:YadA-like family protein n=1 Tax=Acinetobacter johnsonii TaxID=40214 RepID=UPI0032B4A866
MNKIDTNVLGNPSNQVAEVLGQKLKQEQSHISVAVKNVIQQYTLEPNQYVRIEKFTAKVLLLSALMMTANSVWATNNDKERCDGWGATWYCPGTPGPQGPTGPAGADGDSAYQVAVNNGFIGTEEAWLESLQGATGAQGEQGLQGLQGEQGIQGVKGDTGAQGEQGLQGLQGEQGIQGVKGDTGATGAQGLQGVQGETGATGYNAYQVAQVNGFNGTITEWLASLKGDMGNTGMTGATGFSAYDVAVGNGFEGSITQWLASLKGTNGTNGISKEVMDAADTYILNQAKTYVNQVGQQTLNQANAYTDSRVNALNRDMRKLEDRTYAAVASSIAIASLPQPTDAGYNMFSAGVGTWEGEQGYAFGLSGVTESNKYVYKVAVTTNSEGDFGAGAAIGWQWK